MIFFFENTLSLSTRNKTQYNIYNSSFITIVQQYHKVMIYYIKENQGKKIKDPHELEMKARQLLDLVNTSKVL